MLDLSLGGQWEARDNRGEGFQDKKGPGGLKRSGEDAEGRDVRQMTDEDLRHKMNREHDDKCRVQQFPPAPSPKPQEMNN